jgi:hypothetical protein
MGAFYRAAQCFLYCQPPQSLRRLAPVPTQVGHGSRSRIFAEEAFMQMTLRLNVLLAVMSFGLIAAVVLGMI